MAETEIVEESSDKLAELMEASINVVMLRKEGLPGHRKLPDARVMVGNNQMAGDVFTPPTMKLLTKEWSSKFSAVMSKAEKLVRDAHPDLEEYREDNEANQATILPAGCFVVASARLNDIKTGINAVVETELKPLVDAFLKEFPIIVEERRKQIDNAAAWDKIKNRIPSSDQLRNSIGIHLTVLPFTFVTDVGKKLASDLAVNMIGGISKAINDEALKLAEKLKKEGQFKDGTFTELRKQFALLKDFKFLAGPETMKHLNAVEMAMGSSGSLHKDLNEDIKKHAGAATTALTNMLTDLNKEVRKDAGGRFRRNIML